MNVKDVMATLFGASNLADEYVFDSSKGSNWQFKDVLDNSIMKAGMKAGLVEQHKNVKTGNPVPKSRTDMDFLNKTNFHLPRNKANDGPAKKDSNAVDNTYKNERNQSDSPISDTQKANNCNKGTEENHSKEKEKPEDVFEKVKQLMDRLSQENLSQDERILLMSELSLALQQLIGLINQHGLQYNFSDILSHQFFEEGVEGSTADTIVDIRDRINDMIKSLNNLINEKSEELKAEGDSIKDSVFGMDGLEVTEQEPGAGLQGGSKNGDLGMATLAEKTKVIDLRNAVNTSMQSPVFTAGNDMFTSEAVKGQEVFNREQVFKQVLEHARLTLVTEEKSEMLLQLKPDYLGKLSLKIVTERGILIAKFTAESQQVKEIIEANLDQLKDALEAQGLNVKGFSVSVGEHDTQDVNYGSNRRLSKKPLGEEDSESTKGISSYDITSTSINPYHVSNSSIDFTA
ncbi:MAG: flagellar hook-length control protein FliK [Clostridiaceae bacterium]|nr:flagellar hook-length control protein FliK [Clostridiaceae bacterium]